VQPLNEWCSEFEGSAPSPIPRPVIDALIDAAIEWAEPRALGIGGGYGPATSEVAGAIGKGSGTAFRLRFLTPLIQRGEARTAVQGVKAPTPWILSLRLQIPASPKA